MAKKCLLHRMQLGAICQACDRGDRLAVQQKRQAQAGMGSAATDQHRAGAALDMVAALLRAGQLQVLAQSVEQGGSGVQRQIVASAVDLQAQRHHLRWQVHGVGGQLASWVAVFVRGMMSVFCSATAQPFTFRSTQAVPATNAP